ncbi:hypothetical protein GCM10027034_12690 [Ramlibacter solisilvae]|uniref:DUF4019 domain-containing protein n=1 Tax=Ramlibacter tataouinensis TaxID=94132 RepID=UPI0009EDDB2D|nr:DUF4019 domain-containing protein [Ramlibacter tataouinensis]
MPGSKRYLSWLAPLAAALAAQGAAAQLKLPKNPPAASAPAPAAAPATPAPAPAPAPDSASAEKQAAGRLAAAGWLVLLDRRDWGRAWETSSSVFRGAVPLASWMDAIPKVREPFGSFVERTPLESVYKTKLEGRPEGEYVSVIFQSKFSEREVQEIVTTVREDGKWRVTGYSTR